MFWRAPSPYRFRPRQFFFPALLAYVLYGALKWIVLGLIGSRSQPEELYFQLEPEDLGPCSLNLDASQHGGRGHASYGEGI